MHLCFIKSDAAHAASEWQCSGHVLVHLARIHSHTAPCFDIFKWNDRPHLTRQDVPYIHNMGQCKQRSPPFTPPHSEMLFFLRRLFSSLLSGSKLWLDRGHFTFISTHVRKLIVIPSCHTAYISIFMSIYVVQSGYFSQIRWKISQWGEITSVVYNANQFVPQIKYWFLEGFSNMWNYFTFISFHFTHFFTHDLL